MNKEEAEKIAAANLRELQTALRDGRSVRLKEYLRALRYFPTYSFRNVMMIIKQAPNATLVNGFHSWRKLGRSVNKGEKGIGVFAPMIGIGKDQDDLEVEGERTPFGFRLVHVFDVSQTSGKNLPEIAKPTGTPGKYIKLLQPVFEEHAIEVFEQDLPPGTLGRSYGGRIAVASGLPDAERFLTLIHELAHELLHQNAKPNLSRSVRETEAESVAFAVSSACGIDCLDHTSDYIGMVTDNEEQLGASLARVSQTSSYLIQKLLA